MIKNTIKLLSILMICGCSEESLDITELDPYQNKLVINQVFDQNKKFSIQITNSVFAYQSLNPEVISDANVSLISNGITETLTYDLIEKKYTSNSIPQIDKTYELKVSHPKFQSISAISKMPNLMNTTSSLKTNFSLDDEGRNQDLLSIKWTDDASIKNYYRISFYYLDNTTSEYKPFDFPLENNVLNAVNTIKLRDGSFIFNDDLFNGKENEISVKALSDLVFGNPDIKYAITLYHLSPETYRYYTTLDAYHGSINSGSNNDDLFGGAKIIYSNVTNGLGIFGAQSTTINTLK